MTRILVVNDDGIHSPGLRAAVEAVLPLGDVVVAAPAEQQTAMGRSYRGARTAALQPVPMEVSGRSIEAYSLEASPASVLRHALLVLFPEIPPDLVVSGINYGENVGGCITASGTVGAALEAATYGIPALASSFETDLHSHHHHTEQDWTVPIHFVRRFATHMLRTSLPFDVDVLKVDIPATATVDTPWRITRLSRQPYFIQTFDDPKVGTRLEEGRLQVTVDSKTLEPDSDVHAIAVDRVVAVTPLSLDLTSRTSLDQLASHFT